MYTVAAKFVLFRVHQKNRKCFNLAEQCRKLTIRKRGLEVCATFGQEASADQGKYLGILRCGAGTK
jgi:hypothetical protein